MIIFDLYGGPGSGKSVAASALYVALKNIGARAALVGEAATELILNGQIEILRRNQLLVSALQFDRLSRLAHNDIKVAISDCPLRMGKVYADGHNYSKDLNNIIDKLMKFYSMMYRVYVHRVHTVDPMGRTPESLKDIARIDQLIYDIGAPYWLEINGNENGQNSLVDAAKKELEFDDITYQD